MQLVFASNNKNKIKEIELLLPTSIQILSIEDIGCKEEIPETADTIEGNAILKANYITQKYGYDCFADELSTCNYQENNPCYCLTYLTLLYQMGYSPYPQKSSQTSAIDRIQLFLCLHNFCMLSD